MLSLTAALGARGAGGDPEGMLSHSADYLEFVSTLLIGWVWLKLTLATSALNDDFAKGLRAASDYWRVTELSRLEEIAARCESGERSFLDATPGYFA